MKFSEGITKSRFAEIKNPDIYGSWRYDDFIGNKDLSGPIHL